jgi:hypothetical protein
MWLHHDGATDRPAAPAEAPSEHFGAVDKPTAPAEAPSEHFGAVDKPTAPAEAPSEHVGVVVVTTAAVHICQGNLLQMVPEDPGPVPDYDYGAAPSHVSQRNRKWD